MYSPSSRQSGRHGERPPAAAVGGGGLLDAAERIWHDLSGLVHDRLQLAALETRLAGLSLVTMIAAGVMVAVLLISAWLGLLAAAILLLIGTGVAVGMALGLGVVANIVVAAILANLIRSKSRDLQWAATVRSLQTTPAGAGLGEDQR